ncbi:hypothetical protein Barb4_01183 [Bacteroidales bacterium Barb4]|nr:hypothetical protein Barb4_01183 [Bacteroidales bacterium Barb4]
MTYAETLEKLHELQADLLENKTSIQVRITLSSYCICTEVVDSSFIYDFNGAYSVLFHNPASPYFTNENEYTVQLDRVIEAIKKIR